MRAYGSLYGCRISEWLSHNGGQSEEVLDRGADEVDMVINLGWVKEKRFHDVQTEIHTLKDICDDKILKVIVETCFLTEEEKIKMCEVVTEAGADFIKTSTGFGSGGATFEDVALFAAHVGENVRIKAAGGIGSFEDAKHFLAWRIKTRDKQAD